MLDVSFFSDVGNVRECNEDSVRVEEAASGGTTVYGLFLADGMGGYTRGEVASGIFTGTAGQHFQKSRKDFRDFSPGWTAFFSEIFARAGEEIFRASQEQEGSRMGTTGVAAVVIGDQLYAAWVGDSRIYLHRGTELLRLSTDHSLVQTLVDSGKLTPEEAFCHPRRNVLTRSVGMSPSAERPDTLRQSLEKDDIIIICSDGLHGELRDDQIAAVIEGGGEKTLVVEGREDLRGEASLAADLVRAAKSAGGSDNITVIAAAYDNDGDAGGRKILGIFGRGD